MGRGYVSSDVCINNYEFNNHPVIIRHVPLIVLPQGVTLKGIVTVNILLTA